MAAKYGKKPTTETAKEAKQELATRGRGRPRKNERVMTPEEVRKKIQVSALLNVLHDVALKGKAISKERLKAIELLLKKAIPDLKAIELTGDTDQPLQIIMHTNVERQLDQD